MKEENYTPDENSGRCVICSRTIERPKEARIIHLRDTEFLAHAFCLLRLRRLACELYETPLPVPTLNRPLTLNEFLLVKRPQTDVEILCCLGFFHQHVESGGVLHEAMIIEKLRYSAFKIKDVPSALCEATDALGYFERQLREDKETFMITKKGREMALQLPKIPE